jgi:hypothetical protein
MKGNQLSNIRTTIFPTVEDSSFLAVLPTYEKRPDAPEQKYKALIVDLRDMSILDSIAADSMFTAADLSNYFWSMSTIDTQEIAIAFNLSKQLHIVGRSQERKRYVLPIEPDTAVWRQSWQDQYCNLNSTSSLEVRKELALQASANGEIMKDDVSHDYYMAFYNTNDDGSIDTYLVGPIGKKESRTLHVGRNVLCHAFLQGSIVCTLADNGDLYVMYGALQ